MKTLRRGFTVVELLIVIVVIGILATLTIIAYNGIQDRARSSQIQSGLRDTSNKLKIFYTQNNRYPGSIDDCPNPAPTNMCILHDNNLQYLYTTDVSSGSKIFTLVGIIGSQSYSVSVDGEISSNNQNLLADGATERTGANEFLRYANVAPIIDNWGMVQYTISFDIKSANTANKNTIMVYMQNGSGARYSIGNIYVPVSTSYVRRSVTVTPTMSNSSLAESWLAFYGTYGTGNIPSVKNVKIEFGPNATQ